MVTDDVCRAQLSTPSSVMSTQSVSPSPEETVVICVTSAPDVLGTLDVVEVVVEVGTTSVVEVGATSVVTVEDVEVEAVSELQAKRSAKTKEIILSPKKCRSR